ncbi:3675_t:CDS:2 [Diversispora eburnea]|uniref:3675_t:CDS:1 n=1 Tax=Diversispora eburnea TaxID=1213867 RepID=A0A9N9FLH8_9GLOM|nr:3675_t:CDS:2 [Diversispora eburnea]
MAGMSKSSGAKVIFMHFDSSHDDGTPGPSTDGAIVSSDGMLNPASAAIYQTMAEDQNIFI